MSKEKQIEEMAKIINKPCVEIFNEAGVSDKECPFPYECNECTARQLYDAGYRKQSEVVREFAEEVKLEFYREFDEIIPSIMADKIDDLVKKYTEDEK